MSNESEKKSIDWDAHCNRVVKACQSCVFFFPTVFWTEEEYAYDEELGCFSFWIWKGYCSNEAMPAKFPKFYHSTRSDKICKWYMKKEEYDQLQKVFGKDKEVTYEEVKKELTKIRGHEYEDHESSYDPDDEEEDEDDAW